jgi:hypothetical protein
VAVKLTELDPQFVCWTQENWPDAQGKYCYNQVDSIAEANGVIFLCPLCFVANQRSNIGVHSICCWAPGVPQHEHLVGPGRWSMSGTGYADLTLSASSSSISVTSGCKAHFFIRNGEITFA